ncbi:STAS-like domain-containing protein [Metabacillus litoralis]|uniref:STAS-like domain-containing protein n=1 Tax=Metabacillus litoralis TaxID=152268 RepID=UPI0020422B27|nr:STAS-like domain-containing protein [Metabacillus litoralis]MCM3411213.1 STAS-like domain-containing protein [Metabacillus litoralis]
MGLEVRAIDHVERCYSNDDGLVIKLIISNLFERNEKVVFSFQGIDGVTSSFVNTAFIELLHDYSFNFIKENLTFVNSNTQINRMIRDRFNFEVKRRKNMIEVPV